MFSRSSTLSMLVGLRALASLRAADMSSTPPIEATLMTQMMANDSRSLERTLSMADRQLCVSLAVRPRVFMLCAALLGATLPTAAWHPLQPQMFEMRRRQQQLQCQLSCRWLPSPYSTRDASDSTFNRFRDRSSCVTKPRTRVPIGWPATSDQCCESLAIS
jgi:hypothetical protein